MAERKFGEQRRRYKAAMGFSMMRPTEDQVEIITLPDPTERFFATFHSLGTTHQTLRRLITDCGGRNLRLPLPQVVADKFEDMISELEEANELLEEQPQLKHIEHIAERLAAMEQTKTEVQSKLADWASSQDGV